MLPTISLADPVCAKGVGGSNNQSRCFLLTERQQSFTAKACSKFVFPNAGALGYYRFDYDTDALHEWEQRSNRA